RLVPGCERGTLDEACLAAVIQWLQVRPGPKSFAGCGELLAKQRLYLALRALDSLDSATLVQLLQYDDAAEALGWERSVDVEDWATAVVSSLVLGHPASAVMATSLCSMVARGVSTSLWKH